MQITLKITEDSKVELVKDNCELVQGECCFTDFVFEFPETIKGHAISEYGKTIEFAECKEFGECVKFVDEIKGDKYELHEACTAFKKIMVQVVLERNSDGNKITWKTIPFTLEFVESINANGEVAVQAQLLTLSKVKADWQKDLEDTKTDWQNDLEDAQNDIKNTKDAWEAFIKASCLRMVYNSVAVPLENEESNGDTIFYLGDNNGGFEYGHYYRCTEIGGVYSWKDLTQDPSLEGVANGIREINKNRTVQMFVGTKDEILSAEHGENEIIIPEDVDASQAITEVLTTMAGSKDNIPLNSGKKIPVVSTTNDVLKMGSNIIPQLNANGALKIGDVVAGKDYISIYGDTKKIPVVNSNVPTPKIDANGVLYLPYTESVTIEIIDELRSAVDYAYLSVQPSAHIPNGKILNYHGEDGEVIYDGETYEICVPINGEWVNAVGKTITFNEPKKSIIPQKRLIWTGEVGIGTNGVTIDTGNLLGKTIEIEYYTSYAYGSSYYKCTYRSNKIVIPNTIELPSLVAIMTIPVGFELVNSVENIELSFAIAENGNLSAISSGNNIAVTAVYEIIE